MPTQGTIYVREGALSVGASIYLEYDHGYQWPDDSGFIVNSAWTVEPSSDPGGSIIDGAPYKGAFDTGQSGNRNPGGVFSATEIGTFTVKCSVSLIPESSETEAVFVNQTKQIVIALSNNIVQRQALTDGQPDCSKVNILISGEDADRNSAEFNKYSINGGTEVSITSASSTVLTKDKTDDNFSVKIWATTTSMGVDTKVNTQLVSTMPNPIWYSITGTDVQVDLPISGSGLTYEYDYGEGGGWETTNKHHYTTAGAKTVEIRDQYGCVRTISFNAVLPDSIDLDDFPSELYISKANSIRMVERVTFDDCEVFPNDENTFGYEDIYKETTYCDKHRIKDCYGIKLQFKSGYDTHEAKVYNTDDTEFYTIPITKVQENIKYEDSRAFLYTEDGTYTYIYFDGSVSVPNFYEKDGAVTVGLEQQVILDIVYLEDKDVWSLKTLKFTSYTDTNVKYTYNRQYYDVYELEIAQGALVAGSEYYIGLTAERTSATEAEDNKTIEFTSIPLIVKASFENTIDISYKNNRNNDIYWQSAIEFIFTVGIEHRISIGEYENTVVGTDDSSYLEDSYGREKFRYKFEPQTLELARKLSSILSQSYTLINKVRYVFDNIQLETIGEDTNDYIITAEGYKSPSDGFFFEEFGTFVGGLTDLGESVALTHRECGRIINPESRVVTVVFDAPFGEIPKGVSNLKVYRMFQQDGIWFQQDVVFGHASENWLTQSGFELIISDYEENFGSSIIEYCFY